ncbi:MAG: hypothetical protein KGI75_01650 [Rhizobiaceae bacterium]|nr:hypothetical protein [Rhizobiaceae bacterium]
MGDTRREANGKITFRRINRFVSIDFTSGRRPGGYPACQQRDPRLMEQISGGNWLAVRDGTFSLHIRAYGGKELILDQFWRPPKVEPAIK